MLVKFKKRAMEDHCYSAYREPYNFLMYKTTRDKLNERFRVFDQAFVHIKVTCDFWTEEDGFAVYAIKFDRIEDEMLFLLMTNDGIEI